MPDDWPHIQTSRTINADSAMRAMTKDQLIQSSKNVLGGTPVFAGTRVPVQTFIDYLEGGDRLDDFLDDFPTVSRAQALSALELAKKALLETPDESAA